MNFSAIPSSGVVGKLLRLPLRVLPADARVRVLQGPLRGMRWIVGASNHGCWLGSYEIAKQSLMRDLVRPGAVAYDVGAHVGFYTLLLSRLVGPSGTVVAFEPLPRNLGYLRSHVAGNRLRNVRLVEAAVADVGGTVHFAEGQTSTTGHLAEQGSLAVRAVRLDDLVAQGKIPPPDYIKIDVEGAGMRVLRGADRLLRESRPTLFLATHGEDVHAGCLEILRGHGYRVEHIGGASDELLARPG